MHEQLSLALKQFMHANDLTQHKAALELGVSQAVISRVINRSWKRKSRKIQIMAQALKVRPTSDPRANSELMQALEEVWNGEPEDALALAHCIRAIGEARKRLVV